MVSVISTSASSYHDSDVESSIVSHNNSRAEIKYSIYSIWTFRATTSSMIFFHPESYPSTLNDSNKWVFQVARLIPRLVFHKMPLWYINGANLKGYPSHWDLGLGPWLNRSYCTGNLSSICQFYGAAGSVMGDFTRLLWSVIWYYRTHRLTILIGQEL